MSAPNFGPINLVDVEIIHWISKNVNPLVALEEKSGDHQSSGDHEHLYKI